MRTAGLGNLLAFLLIILRVTRLASPTHRTAASFSYLGLQGSGHVPQLFSGHKKPAEAGSFLTIQHPVDAS